jgi:hypothetical protein
MNDAPRPWYHLYPMTFVVMLITVVVLSPLLATVIHAFYKTYNVDENRWTGPVRLLAMGLMVFCVFAVVITAMVSERWHRLRSKPPADDIKEVIEAETRKDKGVASAAGSPASPKGLPPGSDQPNSI